MKPWHLGSHLRVLSESFPMHTNMTGFRWFSKVFASLCFGGKKPQLSKDASFFNHLNPVMLVFIRWLIIDRNIRVDSLTVDVITLKKEFWLKMCFFLFFLVAKRASA